MDTALSIMIIGTSIGLGKGGALVAGPEELNMHTQHTRRGVNGVGVVIDRELISGFRIPQGLYLYLYEDFITWLSLIQSGYTGHRFPVDLGRYRLSKESRGRTFTAAIKAGKSIATSPSYHFRVLFPGGRNMPECLLAQSIRSPGQVFRSIVPIWLQI